MNEERIIEVFDHAQNLRKKSDKRQAFIYLVGCYAAHTKPNCLLREYWAEMRNIVNHNFAMTNGEYTRFLFYYEASCNIIFKLFGRYAWYNTLSIDIN